MRFGAGRKNITVLGVCSDARVILDPLIIFKGQSVLSLWHGGEALPNTMGDQTMVRLNVCKE